MLSDADHAAGAAYGVGRERGDRYYDYARRVTYVIDPEGVVQLVYVIASSQIPGHPARVLRDLGRLVS